MNKEIFEIKNEEGLDFSVQETPSYTVEGEKKVRLPNEITFLVEGITKYDLVEGTNPDGDSLALSISKDEAEKLAKRLLEIALPRRVPTLETSILVSLRELSIIAGFAGYLRRLIVEGNVFEAYHMSRNFDNMIDELGFKQIGKNEMESLLEKQKDESSKYSAS